MLCHTIAAHFRTDPIHTRELRAYAVDEVKRTNGQVSFENAVRSQRRIPQCADHARLPVPVSPLAHAILKAVIIWRLQMKHYLKALKQKNSLLFSVGIVMLLVLTLCLSGCSEKNEVQDQTNGADTIPNQSASAEEPSSILYVNHQLGFSMEMPLNWMGQVEVEEEYGLHHQNGGNCITFYHKPTHDNGEGGILFFIDCYPGEWSEDNPPVIAGHSVVVAQTENYTYLLRTPSDVEYSESDPMLAEAYQSLIAQQDLIISHIYATGQTVIPPNE